MTIPVTTRAGKGSALTPTEMDTNLTNLARDASTAVQGNVRLATIAETQALSSITLPVTPGTFFFGLQPAFEFLSQSVTGNGYFTIPGGIIVQWGSYNFNGGAASQTISLPKTYPTAHAAAVCSVLKTGTSAIPTAHVQSTATNSLTVALSGGNTFAQLFWISVGY